MNLIIDGDLTAPPSSISCFRDVSLYAKCFLNLNVLVECEKDLIDFYWYWLKDNASYDFVDAMIYINEESGFKIACDGGNFNVRKIDYENEWDIIRKIEAVFKKR